MDEQGERLPERVRVFLLDITRIQVRLIVDALKPGAKTSTFAVLTGNFAEASRELYCRRSSIAAISSEWEYKTSAGSSILCKLHPSAWALPGEMFSDGDECGLEVDAFRTCARGSAAPAVVFASWPGPRVNRR
jgi:hypothetical protein